MNAEDSRATLAEIKDATHIISDTEVKALLERTTQPKTPAPYKAKPKKGKKMESKKSTTVKKSTVEQVVLQLVKETASLRKQLQEKGSTKMNKVMESLLTKAKTLVDENNGIKDENEQLKEKAVTLQEKYDASVELVGEMAKAIEEMGPSTTRNKQGDRRRTRKPGMGRGRRVRGESRRPLREGRKRPLRQRSLREERETPRVKPATEKDPAGNLAENKSKAEGVHKAPANLIEACQQKGM